MIIPTVFWLVPIASLVALGMAFFFFRQMMAEDEGTPRMKEIALYVRKGAMAYLKQQYKVVGIVLWCSASSSPSWPTDSTSRTHGYHLPS